MKDSSELGEQYEAKLGYQNELNRLQARKSRLSEENTDLKADLERLEKRYNDKKGVLDRLVLLNGRDVSNEDLIYWDEILNETDLDLITIRREMAKLGGLRQWFESKFQNKRKLEGEIESLNRQIESLKNQRETYEAELTSLTTGALAEAKHELERLPGIIEELRIDLLDPETGLKAESLGMIDDTHKGIGDLLRGKEKQWTQLLQEGEDKIRKMDDGLEELLNATYSAGEKVGEYKALEPVHMLQTGEDPGYNQGLMAIFTMVVHFRTWFKKNGLTKGIKAAQDLIDSIEEELRDQERTRFISVP